MKSKMIIIEDEKMIREGLMQFEWEQIGVDVVATFDNGISALEFLHGNTVDILLTDIRMPLMNGIELVKTVRKEFPETAIVCLSGYSDYEYLRECMQQGVKDYLLKPIDKKELFRVISRWAAEASGEDEDEKSSAYIQNYAIRQALEYIETNYNRPIKIEDVAKSVCLSPVYFSYVFKKQTGIRFVDYLADFRIKKAIELMKDPMLTMHAIANSVGFVSPRYFAETFKKRKGMTPSEYRNKKC